MLSPSSVSELNKIEINPPPEQNWAEINDGGNGAVVKLMAETFREPG